MLNIIVSREKKYRNKEEWRYISVSTLELPTGEVFEAKGDDYTIRAVAKKALEFNPDLGASLAEVTRDGSRVLNPRKLDLIATGKAWSGGGEVPEGIKKWRESKEV